MGARLRMLGPPDQGKVLHLLKERNIIGRAESASVIIKHASVSRAHACILVQGDSCKVQDYGSRNGTFVNERPVYEAHLGTGDELRLGSVKLLFEVDADVGTGRDAAAVQGKDQIVASLRAEGAPATLVAAHDETDVRSSNARLRALLDLSTSMHQSVALNELLAKILDQVAGMFNPDRASILLLDPRTGMARPAASWSRRKQEDPAAREMPVSTTICRKVINGMEAVVTQDAMSDERFTGGESISGLSICAAMCAPLVHRDRGIGLLYVDKRQAGVSYGQDDLQMLAAVAGTVSSAVSNAIFRNKLQEHERVRGNLSRFFSPAVLSQVTKDKSELTRDRLRASILFCDLRGFTSVSRQLGVEQVVQVLNRFYEVATHHVFDKGGTLDKFLGDGLMAIFGAPIRFPDYPNRAVRAAIGIMRAVGSLNKVLVAEGLPALEAVTAVASGEVIVGPMGSQDRMEYTAIGQAVNLASRFVAMARPGQVLVDRFTMLDAGEGAFQFKDLGKVQVKGFKDEVQHFEVDYGDTADSTTGA